MTCFCLLRFDIVQCCTLELSFSMKSTFVSYINLSNITFSHTMTKALFFKLHVELCGEKERVVRTTDMNRFMKTVLMERE